VSVETEEQGASSAETSLRDDLKSALDEIKKREEGAAETGDAGAEPATSPVSRDAQDGRPPKRETLTVATSRAAEPGTAEPAADAPAATEPAPKSWRQDEAADWAELSPKARAAVLRREREIATLVGRQDNERQFGREIADIFRPYAEDMARSNATPQLALATLLDNHRALRSGNPQERIDRARKLLFDYGIDPRALAEPDPRFPQDPHVLQLMRQVETMGAQLAATRGAGQGEQAFAPLPEDQSSANVLSDIEAFRSDPAHPHFDHVAGHMAGLIESGAAPDLESAYQMAVLARPALRSTPPAALALETQRSEKVAAARRAAVSVQGSPGTAGTPRPATLRDELRENLRRALGG
jgi:hypothetical protein